MEAVKDRYIEENRWFITASKLKAFMKSPEYFFIKYLKEAGGVKDPSESMQIWNAVDYYISYWKEKFYAKYYHDLGLKKDELVKRLSWMWTNTKWLIMKDLNALYYGDTSSKIRLTTGMYTRIIWCIEELSRQPLFDIGWDYETQKTYTVKYKSLKLKWTLDRDLTMDGESLIRDTKTTKSIRSFVYDWSNNMLWYDISMGFYWLLKKIETWLSSRLVLDVVQNNAPFPSRIFIVHPNSVENAFNQKIKPALDKMNDMMVEWKETWDDNVWKESYSSLDEMMDIDLYGKMDTTIQKDMEIIQ